MRAPAVADRFYPGDPAQLRATMAFLVPDVPKENKQTALAVIVPHAGYVYSGATAGATISRVQVPETVLILGPNHTGRGTPLSLGIEDWAMPMGAVPVDRDLAASILKYVPEMTEDMIAHRQEHSLEVQLPFLQQVQPRLKMVPIILAHLSYGQCVSVARGLATAIKAQKTPVLMVASTDMSHYESRLQAATKDRAAIERILALDPQGLYATVAEHRISMCGVIPTTITLLAALELGATRAELVQYTDSGEASGDTSRVVGYAGLVLS